MALIEKVDNFFNNKKMDISKLSLLIAFSGGIDSSVLLHVLSRQFNFQKIFALHVAHNLRSYKETEVDIEFCRSYCKSLGVDFVLKEINSGEVAAYADEKGCGIEAAARDLRYVLLQKAAAEIGAEYIVLGHHGDDQAETVLMRVLAGNSFSGLKGMGSVRDCYIRPLLEVTGSEIDEYVHAYNIKCSEDLSNNDLRYKRNLVRKEILPYLQKFYPSVKKSLVGLAAEVEVYETFFSEILDKLEWRETAYGVSVEYDCYSGLPDFLKMRIIYKGFDKICKGKESSYRLPSAFVREAVSQLIGNSGTVLGHGLSIEIVGKRLFFSDYKRVEKSKNSVLLTFDDKTRDVKLPFFVISSYIEKNNNIPLKQIKKNDNIRIPVTYKGVQRFVLRNTVSEDRIDLKLKTRTVNSVLKKAGYTENLRFRSLVVEYDSRVEAIIPFSGTGCYDFKNIILAGSDNNGYFINIEIIENGVLL